MLVTSLDASKCCLKIIKSYRPVAVQQSFGVVHGVRSQSKDSHYVSPLILSQHISLRKVVFAENDVSDCA